MEGAYGAVLTDQTPTVSKSAIMVKDHKQVPFDLDPFAKPIMKDTNTRVIGGE